MERERPRFIVMMEEQERHRAVEREFQARQRTAIQIWTSTTITARI